MSRTPPLSLALTLSVLALSACNESTTPNPPATAQDQIPVAARPAQSESGFEATAGRHLWAVIDKNGNLVRGSRVTSVARVGIGMYEVTFYKNVTQCAYVATTINASSQALLIFTASGHQSTNGVFVEIREQTRIPRDGPFNLVVTCDQLGLRFAVIGYSANLVRATAGTTLTTGGNGQYYVTFTSSIARCSHIVTVGDPGNGSVPDPAVVVTARGPANTVYVQTKSTSGGEQPEIPFHLALICSSTRGVSRYAVVKGDGTIRRASAGTTSARIATGRYTITSDRDLTACATVATRGSPSDAVPSAATLEIVAGPTSNAVGFRVRKLLYSGAGFTNQGFHAAIVC